MARRDRARQCRLSFSSAVNCEAGPGLLGREICLTPESHPREGEEPLARRRQDRQEKDWN